MTDVMVSFASAALYPQMPSQVFEDESSYLSDDKLDVPSSELVQFIQATLDQAYLQLEKNQTFGQLRIGTPLRLGMESIAIPNIVSITPETDNLPEWVRLVFILCSFGWEDSALKEISLATSNMKSTKGLENLNRDLKEIKLASLPDIVLVGILRNIFSVRASMEDWDGLVAQAEEILLERKRNPRTLLRGLKQF